MFPLRCTVPANHLKPDSRTLATFQNVGKARKQGEAILERNV